jgi:predicted RNA-binding Zn-ribbon protein involved in translation (DUF1610 family)
MNRKKINLDKAVYQGVRNFSCPECGVKLDNHDLDTLHRYVIGYGKWSNSLSEGFGLVFECPECFTKSWCHTCMKENTLKMEMDRLNNKYNNQ